MANCYEIVSKKVDLRGYSWDLIVNLKQSKGNPDECFATFYYLEARYG